MLVEGTAAIATDRYGQSLPVSYDTEGAKRAAKVNIPDIKLPGSGAEPGKPSEQEVIRAIETANKKFEIYNTRVEFSIHEKTHEIMIKVYKNDEVIREIPPEKILDMVAKMLEMAGLLVDEKA